MAMENEAVAPTKTLQKIGIENLLKEEEKEHIRAEEVFRQEVRREIEQSRSTSSSGKQLWSLLNSSFALWFLSSVVLGSLTAVYTMYQKSNAEHMRRAEIERRLDVEIGGRISNGLTALRLDQKRIERGAEFSSLDIYMEAISYLNNRVTYIEDDSRKLLDFSIYPEYQQRNFQALTFDLGSVVRPSRVPALREARASYDHLTDLADQSENESASDRNASLDAIKKSIEILEHFQANSFWQGQL